MEHNQQVFDWLSGQKGYEYVVLASPFRLGESLLTSDGVVPAERDLYLQHLHMTVASLRGIGLKPVFVAPPPVPGYDMGRCWARMSLNNRADYCNFSYAETRQHTIATDEMMELVQRFAPVVFLRDLICLEGECGTVLDGVPIYRDVGHFSMMGSAALGARFQMPSLVRKEADRYWDAAQ